MFMKILTVEDDPIVAQTLKLLLTSYNYVVDIAMDGEAGLQLAESFDYDLILLDVILPKLDGISLCQALRTKGLQSPILLLTGQGGGQQKANALNAGADDYVVKPFDAEELIARVQALLRRSRATSQSVLTWGQLSIDPNRCKVAYGTELLSVTPKEYAILELFLRTPQKALSARSILEHAWTSLESPGEEAVRVHIKGLRQKLAAVGAPKDLIKTVHRVGYQLNPLYSSSLAFQMGEQATAPQIAELKSVNEELREALEELSLHQEELRQANEELAMTRHAIDLERQRYHDLFELAPDGYLVTDRHGVIQEANRAAAALLAIKHHYLIGKPITSFVVQSDRPTFRTKLTKLHWEHDWEVVVQPRQGNPFPVLVAVTNIQNAQHQITGLRWMMRDIRQRKQMEQQIQTARDELELRVVERTAEVIAMNQVLQQQQEQWQALFDHTLDAITIANDEGCYIDANPAACELFGASREDLLRSSIANFADPHLEIAPVWQQFLQQGAMKGEFCLYRPDGTIRHTEFAAIANYVPGRHLSVLRDISDRKRAEMEIRKFVSLADHSSEFIGMCDMNFIPFYVNTAGKEMVGLADLEQYQKATVQDFFFPEDQEFIIHEFFPQVLREGKAEVEIRFRHFQTGEALWMIYSVICIRDEQGEAIALATISRNITDRKQAELELKKSEERFRVLSDISPVGIFRNDLQGRCTYANAKTLEITGLSLEQNLGEGWGKNLHPDDHDWMYAAWSEFVEQSKLGHHPTYQVEHRYLYEDGSIKWVFAQAVPEYDTQGELVGFIGCVIDISERKQLEMKLQALNLAKDDFLSTVSHELRTPLTSIKLTVELLELALGQQVSNLANLLKEASTEEKTEKAAVLLNRVPHYLSILKAECGRELNLVNNLLELQHLELGEVTPIWGEMNFLKWLAAIVSSYQEQATARTLTLHLQMPEVLPTLVSDAEKLTSVVRELLANACKYTPPDEVITVEVKLLDERVQLSVSNTGKAIPADALPHLFDKFYRVPGGDRWKQGGTGLGLALVKQQVESLGGRIRVSSDAEQTVFTVELPLRPQLGMKVTQQPES